MKKQNATSKYKFITPQRMEVTQQQEELYMQDLPMDSSPNVPILWQPFTSRIVNSKQPNAIAFKPLSLRK